MTSRAFPFLSEGSGRLRRVGAGGIGGLPGEGEEDLVESGLARDDAYRRVQLLAMRAWDEDRDFGTLVRGEDALASRVDLESVFALDAYLAHVDTVFERLRALRATREAAVHG